ncbi:MAG: hypothetical protein KKA42_16705 [candidate division Zixibacteria bacterium]|nr:hypothetical protein [candidate division Zixibacteria bacterium]
MKQTQTTAQTSGLRRRKNTARELLFARDADGLQKWAATERNPLRLLNSLLYDPDPLVQWRTIEALGPVSAFVATADMEKVRRHIRKLLWGMNDESGDICWKAPEAIGETLRAIPELIAEYAMLLPAYFVEEPFERGSRWAVARVAEVDPAVFAAMPAHLTASLRDADPYIRAYSGLVIRTLNRDLAAIAVLQDDRAPITVYDHGSGDLVESTVVEVALGSSRSV